MLALGDEDFLLLLTTGPTSAIDEHLTFSKLAAIRAASSYGIDCISRFIE
jgi:hypothetical protein